MIRKGFKACLLPLPTQLYCLARILVNISDIILFATSFAEEPPTADKRFTCTNTAYDTITFAYLPLRKFTDLKRVNPLSPDDTLKHHFASLNDDLKT